MCASSRSGQSEAEGEQGQTRGLDGEGQTPPDGVDLNTSVLVVDDDPDALALMSVVVESLGLSAQLAHDGNEALERIREKPPAFVLLDIMMPGLDGFAVLRHLQMNPKTRDTPVLILTAARLQESDVLDLRGTVLGVIQKGDLDVDEIGKVITETLKGKSSSKDE